MCAAPAAAQNCPPPSRNTTAARLEAAERCLALQSLKNAAQDQAIREASGGGAARLDEVEAKADAAGRTAAAAEQAAIAASASAASAAADARALSGAVGALETRVDGHDDVIAQILRDLNLGGGTPPDPIPPPAAATPNTNDGRPIMQMGPAGFSYFDVSDPFRDVTKVTNASLTAFFEKDGREREATHEEVLAEGVMDPETLLPTKMGRFTRYTLGVFAHGMKHFPEEYAGTWVIEWAGAANVAVTWCWHRETARTANRIELELTPDNRSMCGVQVSGVDSAFKQFRIFRKTDEAGLAAGEVFSERFLNHLRRYKVIRTMDWQHTNVNPIRAAGEAKSMNAARLGTAPAEWAGRQSGLFSVPLRLIMRLARETDTALWMTTPQFLGAPPALDAFFFDHGDWNKRALDYRAAGREHARAIIASPEWDRHADEIVKALNDERYPADRMLYLEVGNEVWNTAPLYYPGTNYYWGVGDGLFPGGDSSFRDGYGYAAARLADAFGAALARAGRAQAYTIVIAGQNAGPWTSERALMRYRQYFTDRGRDPAPHLARAGVSTASYYYGAMEPNAAVATVEGESFAVTFLNEIRRDRAGLIKRVVDWTITGGPNGNGDGSLPNIISLRRQHIEIAERFGARFIGDYEGESHDQGIGALNNTPEYREFIKELRYGPEAERMTKAWIEALRTQKPEAMISNFVGVSEGNAPQADVVTPWQDCYYDEPCGKERALEPHLRPVRP